MSNRVTLTESVSEAPTKAGKRWRVIVARPGQGSSGRYSAEMFKENAANVILPGGQSFINHDPSRKPTEMIGTYPDGSFWDDDEQAVVAELAVFSHWADFVEEVGPHCGMSIYAAGEKDEDGNITEIFPDVQNGADLVARPGLVGSGLAEKLYESAKSAESEKPSATVAQEKRNEEQMDEKLDKLIELMTSLVADKTAAQVAEAQIEADEAAVATAVESYDAAVKAVDKAELFESQREVILAAAKKGEDVEGLIESAKKIKAEALEAAKTAGETHEGVVMESKYETAGDLGKVLG